MRLHVTPLRLFLLAVGGQCIFGIVLAIFGGWSAVSAIAVVPEAPPSVIIGLFWGGVCLARALAPLAVARFAKREVVTMAASGCSCRRGRLAAPCLRGSRDVSP